MSIHTCYIGSKVVLALVALDLGASQLVIGLLIACYGVVPTLLGVFAGRLADTAGMRLPMLIGSASVGVAMVAGYLWHSLGALFQAKGDLTTAEINQGCTAKSSASFRHAAARDLRVGSALPRMRPSAHPVR